MGLIIDLFAGGGGASLGIEMALGRSPDVAINHSRAAVAMHAANHPSTRHFCQDVWTVDPLAATGGQPVDVLWASPDCTHFSKAKGAAPKRDAKIRDLAWVVAKWARQVRPAVILLENVEEFTTWGPLDASGKVIGIVRPQRRGSLCGEPVEGEPVDLRGSLFRAFVRSLRRLGYAVQWRELRACDYGAPTIRKRLFLIARRDGRPIVWPEPTHGPGRARPYRAAAEIIDWSIPCPSIFERKRPLAENTQRRIAEGIRRFVLEAAEPFVIGIDNAGARSAVWSSGDPLRTVIAEPRHAVVAPSFVTYYGPKRDGDVRGCGPDGLLGTQTTENRHALVAATLVTNTTGHAPSALDAPVSTLTTGQHQALVTAGLVGVGGRAGQSRPRGADEPTATGTSKADTAVVTAWLAKHYTGVVGQEAGEPLGTVTTVDHHSVISAHIARQFGNSVGSPADDPLGTTTAGGGGKSSLVTSHLVKFRGTCRHGQRTDEPAPTVTASGNNVGEVRAFLTKYYGTAIGHHLSDPAATVTSRDRMGLVTVTIGGEPYVLADIGMRMLQPRELFRAQGFPDSYVIDLELDGRPLSKAGQVKCCGNSVPPDVAAALASANCTGLSMPEPAPAPLLEAAP